MQASDIFNKLWIDYSQLNPVVDQVVNLLKSKNENIVNDHIALRTIEGSEAGIEKLSKPFLSLGYQPKDVYEFKQKKLNAQYFSPPTSDLPRVFISELKLDSFSPWLQSYFANILKSCQSLNGEELLFSFCPWGEIKYDDYEKLLKESEYAAWMAIYGYRANHFTVSFDKLHTWSSLKDFNSFLKENGVILNSSGGEIKGTPDVYLEQSSTLASKTEANFKDGVHTIPCCYFEFAKRYQMPNGKIFDGFIADSADKIFESTDVSQSK